MSEPNLRLRLPGRALTFTGPPRLMGIVNATPDSFSDAGLEKTVAARVARARELIDAGAAVIDIGGESGSTDTAVVDAQEEIERVVPVIEAVSHLDCIVSVDTYKPAVAAAAVAAGASIINDVSALADPELADVAAEAGAGLILMHNRARPKQKLLDRAWDRTIVADVSTQLGELIDTAVARGVDREQIMLDPGPDFGKTPYQTVLALRAVPELRARYGRPILMAVSRKDFIGAITATRPQERLAGTLAALAYSADAGTHLIRIHDVRAAAEFLAVREVLAGRAEVSADLELPVALRRQR